MNTMPHNRAESPRKPLATVRMADPCANPDCEHPRAARDGARYCSDKCRNAHWRRTHPRAEQPELFAETPEVQKRKRDTWVDCVVAAIKRNLAAGETFTAHQLRSAPILVFVHPNGDAGHGMLEPPPVPSWWGVAIQAAKRAGLIEPVLCCECGQQRRVEAQSETTNRAEVRLWRRK